MINVIVKDGESIEMSLRRFKRECLNAGILAEVKRHEFFEKPSQKNKRKREAARRKISRKRFTTPRGPVGFSKV